MIDIKPFGNSRLLFFAMLLMSTVLRAQEDSIPRIQDYEGITISVSKAPEPVYSEFDSYVMDIEHIDSSFFILMREIFHHHLVLLDDYLNPIDTFTFDFHPLDLLEDCQHNAVVLSKDSMFVFANIDNKLKIVDRDSKIGYFRFTKPCVGSIYDHFYMQSVYDQGNSTFFFDEVPLLDYKRCFYTIVDSSTLISDREEMKYIGRSSADARQSAEISQEELRQIRWRQDHATFFNHIKKHGNYHPLFTRNDSVFVFDHYRNEEIIFDKNGNDICHFALSDTLCTLWNGKIYKDEYSGTFYVENKKNGVFTLLRLSEEGVIERAIPITEHIFPENIFIYRNYVFFTGKDNVDDNLNKLYKQRL